MFQKDITEPVQIWYWPKKKKIEDEDEEAEEEEEEEEDKEDVSEIVDNLGYKEILWLEKKITISDNYNYNYVIRYKLIYGPNNLLRVS